MGVYIPNMEMPKNAFNCSNKINPEERRCIYTGKVFEETLSLLTDRPCGDCPLLEIDEEVFRQLKESAFIIKALYKKLKEKYKCVEEDVEEGVEEDFDPYQGDRDRDTYGEIY